MRERQKVLEAVIIAGLLGLTISLGSLAQATAGRNISPDTVLPGGTVRVTVSITISENLMGLGLDEDLPGGWSLTPVNNGGGTYSPSETAWLWLTASTGESKTVVYDVTVPVVTAPGAYQINGVVKSALPLFSYPVGGEGSVTVQAQQYTLTMAVAGNGTTTPSVGMHTYDKNTVVTLTATPDAGWLFDRWSGDVTGSANPTTITMNANKSVTAHFVQAPPQQYTLTMAVDGNGSTTPAVGDHTYDEGAVVPLTATPDAGWVFDRWSGDVTGSTNPTTITMSTNKSVTAHFLQAPPTQYALTVAVVGNGTTNPSVGTHTYDENTVVTLTATPAAGWQFDRWSGDLTGSTNPTSITMNENKSVKATFQKVTVTECTTLPVGWNMISIPGDFRGPCFDDYGYGNLCCAICDDLDPCFIFHYDPQIGGYVMVPPCEAIDYQAGMGFWVRTYENPVEICVDVASKTEKTCIPLQEGWNQIGNPFNFEVALSNVTVKYQENEISLQQAQQNGWVSMYLFGYDTSNGGYGMLDPTNGILQPWTGYWIRAYVNGEICIPPIPAPPTSPSALLRPKDLGLTGIPTPPPPPEVPGETDGDVVRQLTVHNVPNPVRSEYTTTFKVEGKAVGLVQAIRVDIYNQCGQKVFTQEIAAKELDWHTVNEAGELVVNGVYLYKAYVKVGDEWIPTTVGKVAVLR